MQIAIIGAGFTGLTAALELLKQGHEVTLFEKENTSGGLAFGFQQKKWRWSLEAHYHHWFANDKAILRLAREIGYEVIIKRPKTSILYQNNLYQLDSPTSVLLFNKLGIIDRFRMALVLGILRFNPYWKPLENMQASSFLRKTMGERAYSVVWEPQLVNKFGDFATSVSLAWFWARVRKRTSSLAYPKGGFLHFSRALMTKVTELGGSVNLETEVMSIKSDQDNVVISYLSLGKKQVAVFDKVIVTLPSSLFVKMTPDLPKRYQRSLLQLKSLGAINLVLRLKRQFLPNNTYWVSVCEKGAPIMAVVEHTHFMDKKYYANEHLVYLGNYFPFDHPYFSMSEKELVKQYDSFLQKLNPDYKRYLISMHVFKSPFAQPIVPQNYSKMIPSMKTPLRNVYLANMQQVYPWDRGTNYAVELGRRVVQFIQGDGT